MGDLMAAKESAVALRVLARRIPMIWHISIDDNRSLARAPPVHSCCAVLCCVVFMLSKGIENGSLLTPFEILEEELPGKVRYDHAAHSLFGISTLWMLGGRTLKKCK